MIAQVHVIKAVELHPNVETQDNVRGKERQKVSGPIPCSSWVLVQLTNSQEQTMTWWSSHGGERPVAAMGICLSRGTRHKVFMLSLQFLQKISVCHTLSMSGKQVNPC